MYRRPETMTELREEREIVAVFDLAGFTAFGPPVSSAELLGFLHHYLEGLFSIVDRAGGLARHIDGNALCAFWPATEAGAENEKIGQAVVEALAHIRAIELPGGHRCTPRIGLACGPTLHAKLAVAGRTIRVALGADRNFATRLSSLCGQMKKEVLFPASLPVVWPQSCFVEDAGPISVWGVADSIPLRSIVVTTAGPS
jgi:class 3 adenylate cyclase